MQHKDVVTIEWNGKGYKASYEVADDLITVSSAWGRKTTPFGGSPPESVAKILLAELVVGAARRLRHGQHR